MPSQTLDDRRDALSAALTALLGVIAAVQARGVLAERPCGCVIEGDDRERSGRRLGVKRVAEAGGYE